MQTPFGALVHGRPCGRLGVFWPGSVIAYPLSLRPIGRIVWQLFGQKHLLIADSTSIVAAPAHVRKYSINFCNAKIGVRARIAPRPNVIAKNQLGLSRLHGPGAQEPLRSLHSYGREVVAHWCLMVGALSSPTGS